MVDDFRSPYRDGPLAGPTLQLYWPIYACLLALVVSAVVFVTMPWIDLAVSGWFYQPGRGFPLGQNKLFRAVRDVGIGVSTVTILGLIVVGLLWALRTERMQRWPFSRFGMNWLFLVATMGIGAGVIINLVTKPVWGRARPVHITQFGGASEFTPAWVIANQCKWNCSFVSGEAGATALVLAFCFVVPARWRLTTLIAGCLFTLLISFARIAVGGHFLSDVVTAWLLMLLVMFILRVQIYHDALLGPMRRWLPAR